MDQITEEARRRLEGIHLHRIEGMEPTPDQISMFEMFEREGWTPERRRAYIFSKYRQLAAE